MRRLLRRFASRLWGTFCSGRRDPDLTEELDTHIQFLAEEYIRRGHSAKEARRLARLSFGNVEAVKQSYREQRGLPLLDSVFQDIRYTLRGIRAKPGFAAVAVLTLGIGIGANTVIFSIIQSVLLRPLAYSEPQRLFSAGELLPELFGSNPVGVNPVHAASWASECPSVEGVAVVRGSSADLVIAGDPVSVRAADIGANLLTVLGVTPLRGRNFLPQEQQEPNARVVILSESLWRSRFHEDPLLIGKTVRIDRAMYQVVGILPDRFHLPYGVSNASTARYDIFRPLVLGADEINRLTGNYNYTAVVRLRKGVSASQALAEIDVVQARFPKQAGIQRELKAALIPMHDFVTGRARAGLWLLAGAVGAVLMIVCVNLANLLLSRMNARTRESAIRTALGASRARQIRLLMSESLLLAISGGALGVVIATAGIRLIALSTALDLPRINESTLNSGVLLFALFLATATGLLFGGIPAWKATSGDPQEALRAGSHTTTEPPAGMRLRHALISVEVGLSAALLIVAGLLASSFNRLLHVDMGFEFERVLAADLGLSGSFYLDSTSRERFFSRLLARAGMIPGVQESGIVTQLPVRGQTWNDPIYLEGGERRHVVDNRYASPGYFRAMNISLRQGRFFTEADRGRAVAVLSEKAAQLLWPAEPNPVGRRFIGEDDKPKTLVGVLAEVRANLQKDPPPMAYYPYWQRIPDEVTLVVRTNGDAGATATAIRAAVRSEDPQLPIRDLQSMSEVIDASVAQRRFQLTLMVAFAAAALLVATLGVYAVVAYSVTRRKNEIGVRMAMGARPIQLMSLVIRQSMVPVLTGLAGGVTVAVMAGRTVRGLLFGVEPADPLTIAVVVTVLLAAAVLACMIPARRAATMDPVVALRFE